MLKEDAEELSDIILNLSRDKNKKIKLPPVFKSKNSSKYGDSRQNLIALIKCSADYEDINNNFKLYQMVSKYNLYGGKPDLTSADLRKIHNWMQLINFLLRAAYIKKFEHESDSKIVELIISNLFSNSRRAFIAKSLFNKYELKPLKYADNKTICKWLSIEIHDFRTKNNSFGYNASKRDWELYGLRGQTKTAYNSLMRDIHNLVKKARNLDENGRHEESDLIYEKLNNIQQNLEHINSLVTN